jgi:hypothetical protein
MRLMVLILKPQRGGFLRPFGLGWFIKEFLLGNTPYDSANIDLGTGAPQADIFSNYKKALIRETAMDRAVKAEERKAKKEKRSIEPDRIDKLFQRYVAKLPYKAQGSRYHSFVVYFSMLQQLKWVEPTGQEEPSQFQDNYPEGQPRKYFRLTAAGIAAPDYLWANPHKALYG